MSVRSFQRKVDDEDFSLFLTAEVLLQAIRDRQKEIVEEVCKRLGEIKVFYRHDDVNRPTLYEQIEDVRLFQPKVQAESQEEE